MPLTRKSFAWIWSFWSLSWRKPLRRSNTFPVFTWTLTNTVWFENSRWYVLNWARGNSKIDAVTVAFFALKRVKCRNSKNNCCPRSKWECDLITRRIKTRVALGTITACITLTMLERMRLTCWVLPQGKALKISVWSRMKWIFYLIYSWHLRWLHRVIIYRVARASVIFWMLFLHSFLHLVLSNLLNVIRNDEIVFYCHLC